MGIAAVSGVGVTTGETNQSQTTDAITPQPVRNKNFIARHVHSATGEFTPVARDLQEPGRGEVSFTLTRKYRSALADQAGDFGRGWTWAHSKRLEEGPGDSIRYDAGRGQEYLFERGENGWTHPQFYAVLVTGNDQFELRQRDGTKFVFEPPGVRGRLRSYEDRNGNSFDFVYDDNEVRIVNPRDREIRVVYNEDGLISQVTGTAGQTWEYEYEDEFLVGVIRPNGSRVSYEYSDEGLLSSIAESGDGVDPAPYLVNQYELIDGARRITRQEHGEEGTYDLWYEPIEDFDQEGSSDQPIYRIHLARKDQGSTREDANIHFTHNGQGLPVRRIFETDTEEVVDEQLTGEERGSGTATLETTWQYNDAHEVIERTDPSGFTVSRQYDDEHQDPRGRGNLLSVKEQAGDATGEYDEVVRDLTWTRVELPDRSMWKRKTVTDENGDDREFSYDSSGNLSKISVPEVTHYDVREGAEATYTRDLTEEREYNEYGQLTRLEDIEGRRVQYEYYGEENFAGPTDTERSGGGFLARVVQEAGDQSLPSEIQDKPYEAPDARVEFEYDSRGRLTKRIDGKGNAAKYEHAEDGVTRIEDRAGNVTNVAYDGRGNVTEVTREVDRYRFDEDSEEVVTETATRTRYFQYDRLGNVLKSGIRTEDESRLGFRETRVDRDAMGRVVRQFHPKGNETRFEWGDRGLLVGVTKAANSDVEATTNYTYTRDGLRATITNPKENTTKIRYDGLRRRTQTIHPNGLERRRSYDRKGQLTQVQYFARNIGRRGSDRGESSAISDGGTCLLAETNRGHDAAGRCNSFGGGVIGGPGGGGGGPGGGCGERLGSRRRRIEHGEYVKRILDSNSAGGTILEQFYDGIGRVLATGMPSGAWQLYTYDANNQMSAALMFGTAGTGEFSSLTQSGVSGGSPYDDNKLYDVIGPDTSGNGLQEFDEEPFYQERRIERDEKDRPVTLLLNGQPKLFFEYDADEKVVRYDDVEQTVWGLRDGYGRLNGQVTVAEPTRAELFDSDGTTNDQTDRTPIATRWELDDNGNLVTHVDPNGKRTQIEYDDRNLPNAVHHPDGTTATFSHDPVGNLEEFVDPVGRTYSFRHDEMNHLVEASAATNDGQHKLRFRRDPLGRVIRATDTKEEVTVSRRYDSLGNVRRETQAGRTVDRGYDEFGTERTVGYPSGLSVEKEYDDAMRLNRIVTGDQAEVWRGIYDSTHLRRSSYAKGVLESRTAYNNDCTAGCISRKEYLLDGEVIDGADYEYNTDGTIASKTWLHHGEEFSDTFSYDTAKRLTRVDYASGNTVEYDYTDRGAIASKTVTGPEGATVADYDATFDENDRYETFGEREFEHDGTLNRIREVGVDTVADRGGSSAVGSSAESRGIGFPGWGSNIPNEVSEKLDLATSDANTDSNRQSSGNESSQQWSEAESDMSDGEITTDRQSGILRSGEPEFVDREYDYDAWGRLKRVHCADESGEVGRVVEWTYGPFDRPMEKRTLDDEGETVRTYSWKHWSLVRPHTSVA